jgi:hypothetical protein
MVARDRHRFPHTTQICDIFLDRLPELRNLSKLQICRCSLPATVSFTRGLLMANYAIMERCGIQDLPGACRRL